MSASAAHAQSDEDKPKEALRRIIHSIEIATHKTYTFAGRVTLRVAAPNKGPSIEYFWGGKCEGTKMTDQKLELMYEAMRQGYTVEIPSEPIKHDGRIYMCMRAIRVIKP